MPTGGIITLQALLSVLVVVVGYGLSGDGAAKALGFGAGIALSNTLLLVWHAGRMSKRAAQDPRLDLVIFVRSSAERFFVVMLSLAAGLGWLKLQAVYLMVGFVLGQLVHVVLAIINGIEKQ